MQPDERDAGFLSDMLRYARSVLRSVEGLAFADYVGDDNLRWSVERRIEIIGEAANRTSQAFRQAHPEIPWSKIIGQRNVLAHEYGEIEDSLVWNVATISIPELIDQLVAILPDEPHA